jgi:hypothetical protein
MPVLPWKTSMLAEHVLSRRLHGANFRHRTDVTHPEYLLVLKEALVRKRSRTVREGL